MLDKQAPSQFSAPEALRHAVQASGTAQLSELARTHAHKSHLFGQCATPRQIRLKGLQVEDLGVQGLWGLQQGGPARRAGRC